jgi:hypothetical protein
MYTAEQLMPKRLVEAKGNLIDGKRYFVAAEPKDENYWQASHCLSSWSENGFYINHDIDWVIDIPDPPDEVMPLEYPKHKPEKEGEYICHFKPYMVGAAPNNKDHWNKNYWIVGDIEGNSDWENAWNLVDYFIPICLDDLNEEHNLDTIAAELELAVETCEELAVDAMIKYLDGQGYDIVKRLPEIAPCPNPECDATKIHGENPYIEEDKSHCFRVACNCGYRGPRHLTKDGAILGHNAIAKG